jgi:hypothetical protein
MIQDPIFIVGSERSGSNLLRLLLNESDEVAVPHPPHLMRDLSPIAPRYGALTKDENFKRLIRHAIKLVDLHFAPWPFRPNEDLVFESAGKRTLYAVYAGIYEQYRAHVSKERWGCKSTFMIHHVSDILRHHKRPRFIHLVRDPRDVAVSARNSVFSHYHPYYTAQLWSREQSLAFEWSKKLTPDMWYTLRYEDLTADPGTHMKRLCKFLDLKYSPSLLRFFEKPSARRLAGLSRSWENVARPVLRKNSGRYLGELSIQEILMVENFARSIMEEFGYKPVSESENDVFEPGLIQELSFQLSENLSMLREEARAFVFDRNAISRLRKKAFLWRLGLRGSL